MSEKDKMVKLVIEFTGEAEEKVRRGEITLDGIKQVLRDWCAESGISPDKIDWNSVQWVEDKPIRSEVIMGQVEFKINDNLKQFRVKIIAPDVDKWTSFPADLARAMNAKIDELQSAGYRQVYS